MRVHSHLQVGGMRLDTEVEVHFYTVSLGHVYQIQGTRSFALQKNTVKMSSAVLQCE